VGERLAVRLAEDEGGDAKKVSADAETVRKRLTAQHRG
jgi:hypothetical protein